MDYGSGKREKRCSMKTITGETDQSGRVVHTVERCGGDVILSVKSEAHHAKIRFDGTIPVNITREHARELAQALMEVAGDGLATVAGKIVDDLMDRVEVRLHEHLRTMGA